MSFTISFFFRGHIYIASVYNSQESTMLYTIYFTDVDLILEFGPKVEYSYNGQLHISKETGNEAKNLLQEALIQELKKAA